ncbi:ABC transporter ATP-binding protein [Rickettsiales bacterium]|nr:ABC transporter ATP-binding protein [Rickettsiales bacterium]
MNKPLLKIENLSVSFKTGADKVANIVKNISFDIYKGKMTAIVGESGSGKSISALSILKLLPYPQAFHPSGSIIYNDKDILKASINEIRQIRGNEISMIFQEPMTALNPLHTIEKQITETLLLHKSMNYKNAKKRCIELLEQVELGNLKERLNAYPHQLSGGQRQRVMIAMALANDPKILIADEPTTALDVTIQDTILKLLKKLQKDRDMAVILITHNLNIVKKISDYVCVMKDGKIIEQNTTKKIFANPSDKYTKHLINSEPKGKAIKLPNKSSIIIQGNNINVSFTTKYNFFGKPKETVQAVKNASLDLRSGETLGIVGESGSGKSTLAFALLRLLKSSGKINFYGTDINKISGKVLRPFRKEMQIVFQDPFASLNPRMTIEQLLKEGLNIHYPDLSKKECDDRIKDILKEVNLDSDISSRYPHEFSGGQRQRIAIARALILKPKLIILDEPTSALDISIQAQIIDLLKDVQKKYQISYIFISHDLKVIRAISHRILVMKNAQIVEEGDTSEIFTSPKTDYTKSLIKASF